MTSRPDNPGEILKHSYLLYPAEDIERAIEGLAQKIRRSLSSTNPVALCLMNGGLVLCGKLLTQLNFPLRLDYIHATRYQDSTSGFALEWIRQPERDLTGEQVLIIDDILDEGATLSAVSEWCLEQGAADVKCAVLCTKQHDRKFDPSFNADFSGLDVPDRYVFGEGMDCFGWWRNTSGIYCYDPVNADADSV